MGWFCDPSEYGKWKLISYDPVARKKHWIMEDEKTVVSKVETEVEEIIEDNKASFNDSEGKRWGDGKVVASIDLPTYYQKIVPAKQAGDDAYIKRFLNDSDNRAYRTFKGTI